MKTKGLALSLALLLASLFPSPARTQVNTATLGGTITDQTGALIPKATVKLQNVDTGLSRTAISEDEGRFTFDFVPIGSYKVVVNAAGFKPSGGTMFNLAAGQTLSLPIVLQLDATNTTVTVTDEVPVVDTQNTVQVDTISAAQVNQLPVQHQDWTTLLQLTTGATKPLTGSSLSATSSAGSGLNINGLSSAGYNLTVDGTNATSNPEYTAFNFYQAPNIINTVNNDSIAEVGLAKGIAPATVGNTVSGNINIVTKSGTNQFHGTLYEINEESLYDARNQFLTSRPRLTFNEYGGSIGGPLLRNRFFFFGSYEGAQLAAAQVVAGSVPSAYVRANAPAVYAPLLALFPNPCVNQSPSVTGCNPADANTTTITSTEAGSKRQKDGNGIARLDYNPNANNLLAVRYIRARPYLLSPNLLPSNSRITEGHTDAVNANYTHSGGFFTFNTRFGFNQLLLNRVDQGFATEIPLLTALGFSSQGANVFLQHGNYITGEQGVAFVKGKHNVQVGVIVQRQLASRYKLVTPSITYSTAEQFFANTPSATEPNLYVLPPGQPPFVFQDFQYGGYIQDDWRLTNRLTLNLGVRYDHFTVPTETANRFFNRGIDPAAPQLGPGFGPYLPSSAIYNADYKPAQPRVGFAYDVYGNGRTSLRGGFGSFYANHTLFQGPVGLIQPSPSLPFFVNLNQTQTQAIGLKYPVDPTAYPAQIAQLQSIGQLSANIPNTTVNPHNPDPYSMQWQIGVQQALSFQLAAEVTYIGTRGLNTDLYETVNLPGRNTNVAPRPNYGSFVYFTTGDSSKYHSLQSSLSRRLDHGVLVQASYTWSKNLTYGDSDLLQATSVQDNANVKGDYGYSPYDIRHRFTLSGIWDLPLLELSRRQGVLARELLQGWQVNGVFTGQTGVPNNITDSASVYPADRPDVVPHGLRIVPNYKHVRVGNKPQYLNCYVQAAGASTPTASCASILPASYASQQAFQLVPFGIGNAQTRPGNLRRYDVRSPGYENLDATLAKTLRFSERVSLRLNLDAFNVLNHTNYGGLSTSVNASTFGQLTSAIPRTMQIGAKVSF